MSVVRAALEKSTRTATEIELKNPLFPKTKSDRLTRTPFAQENANIPKHPPQHVAKSFGPIPFRTSSLSILAKGVRSSDL